MTRLMCKHLKIGSKSADIVVNMCQHLSDPNYAIYLANQKLPMTLEKYREWCSVMSDICDNTKLQELTEEDFFEARTFLSCAAKLREDVIYC